MIYKDANIRVEIDKYNTIVSLFCEPHYSGTISFALLTKLYLEKSPYPISLRNEKNELMNLFVYQTFAGFFAKHPEYLI